MTIRIAFVLFPTSSNWTSPGRWPRSRSPNACARAATAWRFVARPPGLVRSSSGLAWPAPGLPRLDRFDMLMLSGGDGVDAASTTPR
jgi:hypothetical protein